MSTRFICLLFVCLLYTIGCSIDTQPCDVVDQDTIYQRLSASYDKQDNETSASATLRFGGSTGTTLELVGSCDLQHNLFELTKSIFSDLLGTSYSGSTGGEFRSHTFVFTNAETTNYTNSITFNAVDFASTISTISKSAGITVSWIGGALENGESVSFHLREEADGSMSVASQSTSAFGATSITLTSSFFDRIITGSGKVIWLVRTKGKSLSQATSEGGWMTGSYSSTRQSITITL